MVRIATIVLVLFMPETIMAGMVLKASEIDSSKVEVGVYAEVIYGMGERNPISGTCKKQETVRGYIQSC